MNSRTTLFTSHSSPSPWWEKVISQQPFGGETKAKGKWEGEWPACIWMSLIILYDNRANFSKAF